MVNASKMCVHVMQLELNEIELHPKIDRFLTIDLYFLTFIINFIDFIRYLVRK